MSIADRFHPPSDSRFWVYAVGCSALAHLLFFTVINLKSNSLATHSRQQSVPPRTVAIIYPSSALKLQTTTPAKTSTPQPTPAKNLVEKPSATQPLPTTHTDDQQTAGKPQQASFQGERDTLARSESAPNPERNAQLPSVQGRAPRTAADIETTQSHFKDNENTDSPSKNPLSTDAKKLPLESSSKENHLPEPTATSTPTSSPPPAKESMTARGLTEIARQSSISQAPTPQQASPTDIKPKLITPEKHPEETSPKTTFQGEQRKTTILGSISRTGTSSLNVEKTPLGTYQAQIARTLELEWQRQCLKHRDYITPGYLTAQFVIQPNGKVSSVEFIGQMQTTQIQKGFTLNAIREAKYIPMPATVIKSLHHEPLTLTFNFFF